MTAKAELADANERLWQQVQRLQGELFQANQMIRKLTGGETLEATQTISASPTPLSPPQSLGVVQCPKCGQWMEVTR